MFRYNVVPRIKSYWQVLQEVVHFRKEGKLSRSWQFQILNTKKARHNPRFFSKYRPDEAVHLKERYGDSLLFLPCGHCESCKLAYRKDWSVRCEMESLLHRDSCFITLTLDDAHVKPLPLKEDLQYFT